MRRTWSTATACIRDQRSRVRPLSGQAETLIDFSKLTLGQYVTMTRAATSGTGHSGATWIDSAGQFQISDVADTPRFMHNTSGTFLGLWSEEQRVNLALQTAWAGCDSIADPPTGWTFPHGLGTCVTSASAYGNADGASALTMTGDGGAASRPYLNQQFTLEAGKSYMFSVYVESITGTVTNSSITMLSGSGSTVTGTTTYWRSGATAASGSTLITGRLCLRFDCASITTGVTGWRVGLGTASASAAATLIISRPQVEECSATCQEASSYIPTTTNAITRPPDYANLATGLFGPTGGSFVVRYRRGYLGTGSRVVMGITDNAAVQTTISEHATAATTHTLVDPNVTLTSTDGASANTRAAVSYGLPSLATYAASYVVNSGTVHNGDLNVNFSNLRCIPLGRDASTTSTGSDWLNGPIRSITVYPDRKTDSQLDALT